MTSVISIYITINKIFYKTVGTLQGKRQSVQCCQNVAKLSHMKQSMLIVSPRMTKVHLIKLIQTSFLNVLNVELKVIALSETWIKDHHISYNLPNYNKSTQDTPIQSKG